MTNKYVFLTFTYNCGDEFDTHGIAILPIDKWEKSKKLVRDYFKDKDVYELWFGTNECISLDSYENWMEGITVVEISSEQREVLYSVFDSRKVYNSVFSFGVCVFPGD